MRDVAAAGSKSGRAVPTIVVAGTSSGVGKTTIAVGLMATLRSLGLRVQPFKVGPDFLDPMHHRLACGGVASVNLDGWMMGRLACLEAFEAACAASAADFAVVEGVMGLHDGLDGFSEVGSTAEMAKWLQAPVLLVVDAWCLSRSAAALVHGYKTFDPDLHVAAVLFNRVSSESHLSWLEQAMASAPSTRGVLIAGRLPKDERVRVAERLLGLVPPVAVRAAGAAAARAGSSARARTAAAGLGAGEEPRHASADLGVLVELMTSLVDIDALLKMATSCCAPSGPVACSADGSAQDAEPCAAHEQRPSSPLSPSAAAAGARPQLPPVRIGVARDEAFCFYYEDNLRCLEAAGATLVEFSPVHDSRLPPGLDGLYLGGGYPELHAAALEANAGMRASVRAFCESGRFVLAECGGLMYLAGRLTPNQPPDTPAAAGAGAGVACAAQAAEEAMPRAYAMCGVLPFDTAIGPRMAMGYCTATLGAAAAKLLRLPEGTRVRSQQYHFSEPTLDGEPAVLLDDAGRGLGIPTVAQPAFEVRLEAPHAEAEPEGAVMHGGTLATYCHLHFASHAGLAAAVVSAARRSLTVASLLPSGTELAAALLGEAETARRLVGVSEWCDFPPSAVTGLPAVTASALAARGNSSAQVEAEVSRLRAQGATEMYSVDVEWLRDVKPGVCLTQEACGACDATARGARAALQRAGLEPERAITLAPRSVQGMLDCVRLLGAALGVEAEAEALHARLSQRLAAVARALEGVPRAQRPSLLGIESVCPFVASGQWLPDMRELAGGRDGLSGVTGMPAARLDWATVRDADADCLVICCCGRSAAEAATEVVNHVLTQPGAWAMRALAASPPRLFVVDHAPFSRPGPRLVDGVEMLFALLHPQLLPPSLERAAGDALRLRAGAARAWEGLREGPAADAAAALFEPVLPPSTQDGVLTAPPTPATAAQGPPSPRVVSASPAASPGQCAPPRPPDTAAPPCTPPPLPAADAAGTQRAKPRRGGPPVALADVRATHEAELLQINELVSPIEELGAARAKARCALLHRVACERGCDQYTDPATGYAVFTADFLRKRPCCGRGCRHCPWGFKNVPHARRTAALAARVTPLDDRGA